MEVYILDDLLRRETVIDRFTSLIWTERFSAFGDFQLVIQSNVQSRNLLQEGEMLAINGSDRIMVIETVEDKDDSDGRSLLTLTGRSLEAVMQLRVNSSTLFASATGGPPNVNTTGTPGEIARYQFDSYCRNNTSFPQENIPFITDGSLYPASTITEPDMTITMSVDINNVYDAIKNLCDIYGLGFRLYRGADDSKLYFDVYSGNDLTTAQTALPSVIFSPDLDNLTDAAQLSSIENYKNVAYVLAPNGSRIVYPEGVDPSISGFDRRVMFVDASDITDAAGPDLDAALDLRGAQELAKNKTLTALDGEIPQSSSYRYRVDYNLGDILELRNDDGVTNRMRVTEQIFVDDDQGERSYPTLSVEEFINPGSWDSWDVNGIWDTAKGVWEFASGDESTVNLLLNGGFELGTAQEWFGNKAVTVVTGSTKVRSGTYAGEFTAAAGDYVLNNYADLGDSPVGLHKGGIWFKGVSGDVYNFSLREYTQAGVLQAESAIVPITANGVWQNVETAITKAQVDTVIAMKLLKVTAGTFNFDDAYINMVY